MEDGCEGRKDGVGGGAAFVMSTVRAGLCWRILGDSWASLGGKPCEKWYETGRVHFVKEEEFGLIGAEGVRAMSKGSDRGEELGAGMSGGVTGSGAGGVSKAAGEGPAGGAVGGGVLRMPPASFAEDAEGALGESTGDAAGSAACDAAAMAGVVGEASAGSLVAGGLSAGSSAADGAPAPAGVSAAPAATSAADRVDRADYDQLYSTRYKIGEFAAMTGMSPSRVRFYERQGLFESHREENGYRYYTAQDAFRANAFRVLLQYGFSVEEAIRMLDEHQDNAEFRQSLADQRRELERQREQLRHRIDRVDRALGCLDLPPGGKFVLSDEQDWLYVEASKRSDFSPSVENARTIALFYDRLDVTSCVRILSRADLEGGAGIIEPSYVIAMPESEASSLEGCELSEDLPGVKRLVLGKCLRFYRRISREQSLRRESFDGMFEWIRVHGYRLRSDVLLVPSFFNLDGKGEDVEILFAPIE